MRAFIQARTSSSRFPGKVLASFRGEPLIAHVLRIAESVVGQEATVVVTSNDPSDDALSAVVAARGSSVFRGPLENVLARFQQASVAYPSEWILRLSADSPLLDPTVLNDVIALTDARRCDLVTTIFPRTFPNGRNAEAIRRDLLLSVDANEADADEQEHVTAYFYKRAAMFRIVNVTSGRPELARESLAVDSREDLLRLERITDEELAILEGGQPRR